MGDGQLFNLRNEKTNKNLSKLESKGLNLIKGINFDGHRVMGQTHLFAKKYFEEGIDELIYLDTVASLYDRPVLDNNIKKLVKIFYSVLVEEELNQ